MKIKDILVLMSTYNGEKYLREQVDSILTQEGVNVHLLVRDDGSKDSTLQILEEYSNRFHNFEYVKGKNVGFVKSFSELVVLGVKKDFEYYAFADQDDVWYKEKLCTAINALDVNGKDKPVLFASNCMLIDSLGKDIRPLRKAPMHYRKGNSLYSGSVQGCSMVFNRTAVQIYSQHLPTMAYHDTWMLYICAIFGKVVYDIIPLFGYRIHSNNTIGMGHTKKVSLLEKVSNKFSNKHFQLYYNAVSDFKHSFQEELCGDNLETVCDYLEYRRNIFAKLRLLRKRKYGSVYSDLVSRIRFYKDVLLNNL